MLADNTISTFLNEIYKLLKIYRTHCNNNFLSLTACDVMNRTTIGMIKASAFSRKKFKNAKNCSEGHKFSTVRPKRYNFMLIL